MPSGQPFGALPDVLRAERIDQVAVLALARPAKRNALTDEMVGGIGSFLDHLDPEVKAVIIEADGDHFCAGLDLNEMTGRDAISGLEHSRRWHRVFEQIEFGRVPVVAALKGAVVGGGLELAAAAHIRVAEESAFYALPEGQRGIFVGGGASVRVPRLIGTHRMIDMMLTGRRYEAAEGQAIGLSQYVVPAGTGRKTALDLARRIAGNAPQSNYAIVQALPRIAQANPREGFMMESLMAGITQATDDAKGRMQNFLSGRAPKVTDDPR
ncbi:MAG: crotonase/enoyl-CoA hydratase family protein [Streptosporangiales bacterium]|nr:crotonase/enoyl-CoA hydratase family protein [Streptosporangiales bacterium]